MIRLFGSLIVILVLIATASAVAQDVTLDGDFIQGGLVTGRVAAGDRVDLDGKPVPIAANGRFLIAFDRDGAKTAKLEIRHANGSVTRRDLTIETRSYDIQRIDGLPPRKVTPSPEDMKRIAAERTLMVAARGIVRRDSDFVSGFVWPARGRISGVYGSQRILNGEPRRPHFGVDIAAPVGTPVVAAADGEVTLVHPGMFFNGKSVVIDHGLGLNSVYIHLSETSVKKGQKVKKGMVVGRIGKTGRATGPHLHWGMRLRDVEIDPALLVDGSPEN